MSFHERLDYFQKVFIQSAVMAIGIYMLVTMSLGIFDLNTVPTYNPIIWFMIYIPTCLWSNELYKEKKA